MNDFYKSEEETDLADAAQEYLDRRDRRKHPQGRGDNGGRWYPSEEERQACCEAIRTPSRAYPWSYMTHCRTMPHIANLYGVDLSSLRRAVREIEKARKEGGK